MSRTATVVVTYRDECLGTVGPFEVESPWWADVEPVVAHLVGAIGVPVAVLRLVDVDGGRAPRGGHVTYHAEALEPPAARLDGDCRGLAGPAPHRAAYATADGLRAALDWAERAAADGGYRRTTAPEQVKTWNLSSLFRLPVDGGSPIWLKLTPSFAAHEPDVIALVASADPRLVPTVLGSDRAGRRVLYAYIPGIDSWNASAELIGVTVDRWVGVQATLADRVRPGVVPERRPAQLADDVRRLLDGDAVRTLDTGERADAYTMCDRLPAIIDALESCGLPETLVHGDFHPGNWRHDEASGGGPVLLDFADAYVGHPASDGVRLREFLAPDRRAAVTEAWCRAWSDRVPGSDPARALALATPLQHLSGAVLYQMFLDNIEPSERRYHADDPVAEIRAALAAFCAA